MSDHRIKLALLADRVRRALRHTTSVERALALVVITRVFADYAASTATASQNDERAFQAVDELPGLEHLLDDALRHLHHVRTTSYHPRESA